MTDSEIVQRMKDAAYQQVQDDAAERRRLEDIALGRNGGRYRLGEAVRVGDDYAVEIIAPHSDDTGNTWTTVVGDRRGTFVWKTMEMAVLHLIARRHETNENDSYAAARYAARVLAVPAEED